ncbi:AAA family ATPase [Polycladidibacter hongkongensis]|uniref:AAA family ATPase n=1 Tax=Polycladidibacter hongkongensis TaxID=1647556 RepID=UPI00082B92B7|nr:AAA family ATPase [Pseudovibrio hongkongensis]
MSVEDTLDVKQTLYDRVIQKRDSLARVIEVTSQQATNPHDHKVGRVFMPREVAELMGCSTSYVSTLTQAIADDVPKDERSGYRCYSLAHITELRKEAAKRVSDQPQKALRYFPRRREDEELAVMAFVNFKGGSAKTTTSVHFAQYAALQGYRVLFLDLDPQGSASTIFGYQPVLIEPDQSVNAALRYEDPLSIRDVIQKTYFEGIDIGLGGQWMTEWEQDTPRVMTDAHHYRHYIDQRTAELQQALALGASEAEVVEMRRELAELEQLDQKGAAALHYYMRLRSCLDEVEDDYDIVVCDTQPALNFATQATIGAANHLLLTIQPDWLDVKSMHQYLCALGDHLATLEDSVHIVGDSARYTDRTMNCLLTRFKPNDAAMTAIASMMRSCLDDVLENQMPVSAAVSQAGLSNSTIYETNGKDFNRATFKRGVEAMSQVNAEIEKIICKGWGRDV